MRKTFFCRVGVLVLTLAMAVSLCSCVGAESAPSSQVSSATSSVAFERKYTSEEYKYYAEYFKDVLKNAELFSEMPDEYYDVIFYTEVYNSQFYNRFISAPGQNNWVPFNACHFCDEHHKNNEHGLGLVKIAYPYYPYYDGTVWDIKLAYFDDKDVYTGEESIFRNVELSKDITVVFYPEGYLGRWPEVDETIDTQIDNGDVLERLRYTPCDICGDGHDRWMKDYYIRFEALIDEKKNAQNR